MIGRVLGSLVRRAEGGDPDALVELEVNAQATRQAQGKAARGLVSGPGKFSWGEVGRWLGITRQAARQRFHE